jgi:hypothetical protein
MGKEAGRFDDARLFPKLDACMADPSRKRDCCVKGAVTAVRLSTLQMLIELFMDVIFHTGRFRGN